MNYDHSRKTPEFPNPNKMIRDAFRSGITRENISAMWGFSMRKIDKVLRRAVSPGGK